MMILFFHPINLVTAESNSGFGGALALAAAIGVSRDSHQPTEKKRPSIDAFDMRKYLCFVKLNKPLIR